MVIIRAMVIVNMAKIIEHIVHIFRCFRKQKRAISSRKTATNIAQIFNVENQFK